MLRSLDRLGIKGHIRVVAVRESTGEEIVLADWDNTVTYDILSNVMAVLSQVPADVSPAERAIHWIGFESSVSALPPADISDTGPVGALAAAIVIDRAADVTLDVGGTPGIVEYRVTLPKTDANGQVLRAVGLYSRGDNDVPGSSSNYLLCARQLIGAIEKTSDFRVTVAWRLQLTAA